MGMQTVWLTQLWRFVVAYRSDLVLSAAVAAVLALLYYVWRQGYIPQDSTGNGIVIGQAKAFDNRALSLRLERLNAALETLKVVNQNVTDSLSNFQGRTSNERSLTLKVAAKIAAAGADGDGGEKNKQEKNATDNGNTGGSDAPRADFKPTFGLASGDVLNNQLNLASQIVNLQTLYERSLSDRMIGEQSRLQTVLGFQISITPPAGYEDCVAVAEVAVRMKNNEDGVAAGPVSLVALIPQEKTYNAETLSSSERSIEGSAVAPALTMGISGKGKAQQFFVHRDSDTIAFERRPQVTPELFPNDRNHIVFGWEFRPVLGRRTVSLGVRQMLAVISLPKPDHEPPEKSALEIRTRSYWRHYDRKRQVTAPHAGWLPWNIDGAGTFTSETQELDVPNTAQIQSALAPTITNIKWVNSGGNRATVIVRGRNLFSGTKVVIGGEVHREEDHNLTLKSDQALEFEAPIASLTSADAVLSGRFGPALKLIIPPEELPVATFEISRATVVPSRRLRAFYVSVDIKGLDANAEYKDFTVEDVAKLPEPILYIGPEPVPMPYDYYDADAEITLDSAQGAASTIPASAHKVVAGDATAPKSLKIVRVEAWVSPKVLARNPSVSFRVPFCGFEYQASMPLSFSEPTIDRLGASGNDSVFRIGYSLGFERAISVELDASYPEGGPQLQRITNSSFALAQNTELILKVPTATISKYQYILVRQASSDPTAGSSDTFLLKVPQEEKPQLKVAVDTNNKPPQITKGNRGPIDWTGSAFDQVADVTFTPPAPPGQSAAAVSQPFMAYDNGTKLEVYLTQKITDTEGKFSLDCTTSAGEKLTLPFFVVSS